jgi:hypothetical protein
VPPVAVIPLIETVEVPTGVPGFVGPVLPPPPPHETVAIRNAIATTLASTFQRRRRVCMARKKIPTPITIHRAAIPGNTGRPPPFGRTSGAETLFAVVVIVSVAVPVVVVVVSAIDEGVTEHALSDGSPVQVTDAKLTVPLNPLLPVTVIVELPDAPGDVIVMFVGLAAIPTCGPGFTVTVVVPEACAKLESPEYVA